MSEQIVDYRDLKAESIKGFSMIANFMWRRANYMLSEKIKTMEQVMVLDPCAGGGKLLSKGDKAFSMLGYESDYTNFFYAKSYLEQNGFDATIVNEPFEFHFAQPYFAQFDLAIGIPCTERSINARYDTTKDCLKMSNYAFYVINRSIDVLKPGGAGIFCIPKNMVSPEKYSYEVDCICQRANILSVETYEDYAIIVLQKNKSGK